MKAEQSFSRGRMGSDRFAGGHLLCGAQTLHFPPKKPFLLRRNNDQLGFAPTLPFLPNPCAGPGSSPAPPAPPSIPGPAARRGWGDIATSRVPPRGPAARSDTSRGHSELSQRQNPLERTQICISDSAKSTRKRHKNNRGCLEGWGWFSSSPHPVLAEGWIWEVQHLPWWFLQKPSQSPALSYSKILSCSWDPFFWMTSFWEKDSGMTASFPIKRHRTHGYSQEWHRSMDLLLSPPTTLKHPTPCITWIKPQHTLWV